VLEQLPAKEQPRRHPPAQAVGMRCAFSFCWWAAYGRLPTERPENEVPAEFSAGRRENERPEVLAGGAQGGKGVSGTVRGRYR
jgi:hypothetical protein